MILMWVALLFSIMMGSLIEAFAADKESISFSEWAESQHFKVYVDDISGRIVVDRPNLPALVMQVGNFYVLENNRVLHYTEAPYREPHTSAPYREQQELRLPLTIASDLSVRELPKKAVPPGQPSLPMISSLSLSADSLAITSSLSKKEVGGPQPSVKSQKIIPPLLSELGKNSERVPCALGRTVQRIFLDPGHGGNDFGTEKAGYKEKDIVLSVAKNLGEELKKSGFTVSLSRTHDLYLPLDIRSQLATAGKADLFVSLHVNSSPQAEAQGTESYILSQDATDAEARKLAFFENSIANEARGKESAVQDILWDMEQTGFLQDSAFLASYIQEAVVARAREQLSQTELGSSWKNRGVRQAPFFVLNHAAMPAVLVEIGYLSNSRDRKLMTQKKFQENLAKGLAEGVKKYRDECRGLVKK